MTVPVLSTGMSMGEVSVVEVPSVLLENRACV